MEEQVLDEHTIPIEELYQKLSVNPDTGLSMTEARERYERDGPNKITSVNQSPTKPEWIKFCQNLFGKYSLLLWVGVIIIFIAYSIEDTSKVEEPSSDKLYLGVILIVTVIAIGIISYIQDPESSTFMDSPNSLVPQYALCLRDGEKHNLPVEELCIGDIVEIKIGERIPADIRIIEVFGFKVDMSSLTGESQPQTRSLAFTHENPLETENLCFCNTSATAGTCKGIVIRIGDSTVYGRIAGLGSVLGMGVTPIAKEMTHAIYIIYAVIMFLGVIIFIIMLSFGFLWLDAVVFLVVIGYIGLNKGVLATVTVCQNLTIKRIAAKNCFVKNFETVDTLSSVNTLCSKTSALTQNCMTVTRMWYDDNMFEANTSDQLSCQKEENASESGLKTLCRIAALCNHAEFKTGQGEVSVLNREVNGNAYDAALLKYVELAFGDVKGWRAKNKKVFEIPFSSTNNYQVSIHETEDKDGPQYLLVMKGSPERILECSSTILINGKENPIDEKIKDAVNNAYKELAGLGERVLGFCDYMLPSDKYPLDYSFDADDVNYPVEGLRFIGLMSMSAPPHIAVPDAVIKCRSAGIKVIVVSGDHPMTAKAIAKTVGIISKDNETVEDTTKKIDIDIKEVEPLEVKAAVYHGNEIKDMDTEQLVNVLTQHTEIVFGRTSPYQKMVIVDGCRRTEGMVVAVTGKDMNDSSALRMSDIGVAMGVTGYEVCKQAAEMILLDDNFSSIVSSIEEGRVLIDNLKKSVAYCIACKMAEIFPFIIFMIAGLPLPLGIGTILCIDVVTCLVPTISLAYEEAESDIMKRQPRNINTDKVVNKRLVSMAVGQIGMIQAAAGIFTYFVIMAENGFLPHLLFGIRETWDNQFVNNLEDHYGQEWTYHDRKVLEFTSQTGFFVAIVVVQWANLIICKTRRDSIFQQGMKNRVLILAICFETILAAFLIYTPGMDSGLRMYPVKFSGWVAAVPFALLIFIYDELRRLILRICPGGWLEGETYY